MLTDIFHVLLAIGIVALIVFGAVQYVCIVILPLIKDRKYL